MTTTLDDQCAKLTHALARARRNLPDPSAWIDDDNRITPEVLAYEQLLDETAAALLGLVEKQVSREAAAAPDGTVSP